MARASERDDRSSAERLGVVVVVADRGGDELAQPRLGRVVAGEGEERGQGGDALAQVGAGRLARRTALADDVEQVVGDLEGDADLLAERGQRGHQRRVDAGEAGAEAGGGGDQRAGLVGEHLEVVLDRVLAGLRRRRSRGSGR